MTIYKALKYPSSRPQTKPDLMQSFTRSLSLEMSKPDVDGNKFRRVQREFYVRKE